MQGEVLARHFADPNTPSGLLAAVSLISQRKEINFVTPVENFECKNYTLFCFETETFESPWTVLLAIKAETFPTQR